MLSADVMEDKMADAAMAKLLQLAQNILDVHDEKELFSHINRIIFPDGAGSSRKSAVFKSVKLNSW